MKPMKTLVALIGGILAFAWASPLVLAGSFDGVLRVEDKAGAFTKEGIKKAETTFKETSFKTKTHLTVVTVSSTDVPKNKKDDFEAATKDLKNKGQKFFGDWTRELAKEESESGIFALVFLEGKHFYIYVAMDEKSEIKRHFSTAKAEKVSEALQSAMKSAKDKDEEQAKATRDTGLLAAVDIVIEDLRNTSGGEPAHNSGVVKHTNQGDNMGTSIGGWICMGLVVLACAWIGIALVRALMGGGGGGGYGGGGYGGGGYGGGGGGFFSSMLGGMFGAAAGMYLYNNMFGGSSMASAGESFGGSGGDSVGGNSGDGDFDNGGGAGGGDFGDAGDTGGDSGGGDFGDSGGGDFGGGGGDFGGGGGDFGGGDW